MKTRAKALTPLQKRLWKLKTHCILGVIDSNGAVKSAITKNIEHHADHFGVHVHKAWRWSYSQSITWFSDSNRLSFEESDAVMRHLTKKYGIPFWENGWHDLDYFKKHLED